MTTALIGHTGFVGGNLARQYRFDDFYNSRNIETIAGRQYELLVCAGAPGVKWRANKEPEADWASISRLIANLRQVEVAQFVLISTVDVYPVPFDVYEDTPIDPAAGTPYGRHRLQLEQFVREQFPAAVMRLPGLFGRGLKKNIIFDLLHQNALELINPDNVFQFYDLDQFWPDLEKVLAAGLPLVNFASEGVSVQAVARGAFGFDFSNERELKRVTYNFKTRYDRLLGGADGYLKSQEEVLAGIAAFVARERAALAREDERS